MDKQEQNIEVNIDGESPRLRRLRRQHEDIRHTLDHHLGDFEEQAERANRIARFDGIILTIFVGLLSSTGVDIPLNLFVIMSSGAVLLLAAVILGLWEQRGREVDGGPKESTIDVANAHDMGEEKYLEWILTTGYSDWVKNARGKAGERAKDVETIARLSIIGLTLLLGGTLLVPVV
ncbi:uncharacterized protein HHUB_4271 (plasmid) [Halobacterium hubeiense]|uniref:Uncharacterized protein n=1 Tax=Halobacterium hubeiense TaxID=1407499 RepID=A0A0U5H7U4_9EURY|nr:hypothetical protein [Halobacterium hubeiense]CQH64082.1 uncharacterized protein HHUB_4271 [Halobacterium hubeiense]